MKSEQIEIKTKCLMLHNLIIFAIHKFSTKQKDSMMKKKITILLVGIFALVINTYAQHKLSISPTVTFTATPSVICPGDTVAFTNTATFYPIYWTWYMPGSTLPKFTNFNPPGNPPTVKYNYPGTYYVTCVVVNSDGRDSVTVQNCVIVKPLPTALIMPPSGGICDTAPKGKVLDTVFFSLVDTTRGNFYAWAPPTSLHGFDHHFACGGTGRETEDRQNCDAAGAVVGAFAAS